jgi:O-antigen ligase
MNRPATMNDLQHAQARDRALVALRLAFIAAAPGILTGVLGSTMSMPLTRYIQMVLYMPAVILGVRVWCQGRSFARSAPVLACVLLSWVGFLYASPQWSEGVEFIAQVTIVLPVAALVVETGAWAMCARTFIYANIPVLAFLFWIEYQKHGLNLFLGVHRFGSIYTEEYDRVITNPNGVGSQFAFVAVLTLAMFLRAGKSRPQVAGARQSKGIGVGWYLVFSVFCLLTASRGAFLSLLAATAMLLLGSVRSQRASRYRDLVAFSIVAGSVLLTVVSSGLFTPWELLSERWQQTDNVASVGNRAEIWEDAYHAWRSDPVRSVIGAGTGAAPVLLGQYNAHTTINDGYEVRGSHSTYVEWGLSFGLLGLVPGIGLMGAMARRALAMDRRDGSSTRTAILICVGVWAAVSEVHRCPSSLAVGSLVLAMLSERPGSRRQRRPAHSERGTPAAEPMLRSRVWTSPAVVPHALAEAGGQEIVGRGNTR